MRVITRTITRIIRFAIKATDGVVVVINAYGISGEIGSHINFNANNPDTYHRRRFFRPLTRWSEMLLIILEIEIYCS